MGAATIFDEESGVAHEGYNAKLLRAWLILTHYTDLDLTAYDTPEGRYAVYDILASHGAWPKIMALVGEDMTDVDGICQLLQSAAKQRHERKHSLEYRLGKVFDSLLGAENLADTIARAEGLNSKLIDMLGALRKSQPLSAGGIQLAKKE